MAAPGRQAGPGRLALWKSKGHCCTALADTESKAATKVNQGHEHGYGVSSFENKNKCTPSPCQSHYREVLWWEIFLEQELTHQSNFTTELMLIIQTYWIQLHTNFGIDLFISDLSMRRTSTASGSLENLKGHHEELYPHYHLVMSRHCIYIRTVHTVSFLEELRIPIFFQDLLTFMLIKV